MSDTLLTEVLDAGKAIGLLHPDGSLNPGWFGQPVSNLETIISNPDQRSAFLDLLDQIVPPAHVAGIPAGEKWHPLVTSAGAGSLYWTVASNGSVKFGLAAEISGSGPLNASLRGHLPLVGFSGNSLSAIAGTADGPFDITLRVQLNLAYGPTSIGLKAISASIRLEPVTPAFNLRVVLEGLDLDGTGPKDTELDSANLGTEATRVVIGLIRQALHEISGASGEVALIIDHLMPLLGYGTDGIPPFPFADLLSGPAAVQGWFNALSTSGKVTTWLGHLAGLFGITLSPSGSGTLADPWKVRLVALDAASSELSFTAAEASQKLYIGLTASLVPAGAQARFDASAWLTAIPLAGNGYAGVLPSASIVVRSLGSLVSTPAITADSLQAGITWNGTALTPTLEIDNVTLTLAGSTNHYDKIDLTNAEGAVASAAANIVQNILLPKLGGEGQHLAALAGIIKPAGDPGWTHLVDPAKLVSNPTGAIAAVHRAALQDSTHNWGFLLSEAAALLGLAGPVSGTGTQADPWQVALDSIGPVSINLVAWNAQTAPGGDPLLRIGFGLSAVSMPWHLSWLAELLAFDLPASGPGNVTLMGGQHLSFLVSPIPASTPVMGMTFAADSAGLTFDWNPRSPAKLVGVVKNISITDFGATTQIGTLYFPPLQPFDLANPKPSIGLDITTLETVVRILLTRAAYSWADMPGLATAILLGLHGNLPGLQSDWPVLSDPGATGAIFTDPLGSLRGWVSQVAVNVSSDDTPFLPNGLNWLAALAGDNLPSAPTDAPAGGLPGNGVYEDPWRIALASTDAQPIELLTWLEPQGPPATWAAALPKAINNAGSFTDLFTAAAPLAQVDPGIRHALADTDVAAIEGDLDELSAFFAASDGVVPLASQVPSSPEWKTGTSIPGAHHLQPSTSQAISQIIAQVNSSPAPHVALLLGPAFSDHNIWTPLLTQAAAVAAGTNFNFRIPNVNPGNVDLSTVTAVNSYYTADLQDDGTGNLTSLTAQIGYIVARLQALQPGAKVVLVAHSTAGLAALTYAAANASNVAGLITLGSPLQTTAGMAPLDPATQPALADALRFVQGLSLTLAAGPIQDALAHLRGALDCYLPSAAAGQLPVSNPYPFGSFAPPNSLETNGVPALALGGTLGSDLLTAVRTALANKATAIAAGPVVPPTHLSFAVQGHLGVPAAAAGVVAVDASIRVDAFRVALKQGIPDPARPKNSVTILATIDDPDGWLAGTATSFVEFGKPLSTTRVRWAEIGMSIQSGSVAPIVRLHDAAFSGPTLPLVDINDPETSASALPLLGAVFHAVSPAGLSPASPVGVLMSALTKLGIAVPDPHGGFGVAADAFAAIQADPGGYIVPHLLTALDLPGGILGISGAGTGPWTLPIDAGPFQINLVETPGWAIGLSVPAASPITFGGTASLSFDASIAIPTLVTTFDLSFSIGAVTLTGTSAGQVSVSALPWLNPLTLPPPAPALKSALEQAIPRVLLSSAVTGLVESLLGPNMRFGPIDRFISSFASTISGPGSLGSSGGNGLDSGKINTLFQTIGLALGTPGPGLGLPGGLQLQATGTEPVVISLSTTNPIGGILNFALDANIDSQLHMTPGGTLSLAVPVPAPWNTVALTFGISAGVVTLAFEPQGVPPIQLLPTFSGLGGLLGAAETLLPAALDALASALPASTLKNDAIALAQALTLHDGTSFANESANWKSLLAGNWWAFFNQPNVAGALVSAVNSMGGTIPGTVAVKGDGVQWSYPSGTPAISASFSVDNTGPALAIGVTNFQPAGSPVTLNFNAGINSALKIQTSLGLGISLADSLGITDVPEIAFSSTGSAFSADFYPLGHSNANILDIQLLPSPKILPNPPTAGLQKFITDWLVPVATQILFNATNTHLGDHLWNGGPTLQAVLQSAGIVTNAGKLILPLPDLTKMTAGALAGMVSATSFDITNTLKLKIVDEIPTNSGFPNPCIGFRLFGHEDIVASESLTVSLRFGESVSKPNWITDSTAGISCYLFDLTAIAFKPRLSVVGLGVDFAGGQGAPLINTSFLRTGEISGYLFFDVNLFPPFNFSDFGAGLEIDQFGIPLGQALGGDEGGSNPVASGLLKSDDGGGDTHPVNPAVDLFAAYRQGNFTIQIQNQTGALWISIHQKFGPIYIEQVGLEILTTGNGPAVALLVDGSVEIAGLTVEADELGVDIPLRSLASPKDWSLDLRGLGVSYNSDDVTIEGGLLKNTSGPYVEYDGMLKVEIAGRGFTAVGSYAQPTNGPGSYTSVFIFVSLPIVLGGPPYFFVTGLGGGAGINRRLLPPDDVNQVPNFLLVQAIDNTTFANDPLGALKDIATQIPARRGSYWFAAGIRFDSFVLVHSVAIVYVALDGGFEIGILGVSRAALPTADLAIASIELALKIRFSTAEGLFSVQAQLTDNSYLFSKDCQLTGGFAFFVWFTKGQFLITVGGYHPAFQKPPEFPSVPRLGFHWSVSDVIVIKGEAYFALTNTCIMAGGRLEVTAHLGPVRAWVIAYADFLISWDPFYYAIDLGVSIGVSLDFDICFIVCGHVHLEVSIGADLNIAGPKFHGSASVHILFFTVTIPFGDDEVQLDYIKDFGTFTTKYLTAGDSQNKVVAVRVSTGLLPPDPPGSKPAPGTKAQPWQLSAEFSFISETRMPASTYSWALTTVSQGASGNVPQSAILDLAPMDATNVPSNHSLAIFIGDSTMQPNTTPDHWIITSIIGLFPEATWRWHDPQNMPAAARTLPAVSGLNLQGVAALEGQSALIRIMMMVDDLPQYALPLPFTTVSVSFNKALVDAGVAAAALAAQVAQAPSAKMLVAATTVLTGNNLFSTLRVPIGAPAQGLAPMAARSLKRFRSAPPLVAPLTMGLTMTAAKLADPPAISAVPPSVPVVLRQPRLRTVMQGRPQPAFDGPHALQTTVLKIPVAARLPRTYPPRTAVLAGAKLHRVPAPKAPVRTVAPRGPRTLHHPETSHVPGIAHIAQFDQAAKLIAGDGVVVPSGVTHVWDVPAGANYSVAAAGAAGLRIVAMDHSSQILLDVELIPSTQTFPLPANTRAVAFQCLGIPAAGFVPPAPGFGAISLSAAPPGGFPAVGWQSGSLAEQLGALSILGRGAYLRLTSSRSSKVRGRSVTQAMINISRGILGQTGIETVLPSAANVVMILLDGNDEAAAANGDLAIAVEGAKLVTPPIPVSGGHRRALLYDVLPLTATAAPLPSFSVAASSALGWEITGIIGLKGKALDWANRLHGDVPPHVAPQGPLSPDGSVRVRLLQRSSS